jgi:hypothetical protein
MFRAPPCPSSEAYNCINSLWFYRWSVGGSSVVCRGLQTTTNKAATTTTNNRKTASRMECNKNHAQNNNFPVHFITNLKVEMKQQKVHQTQDKDGNKKRATFTYYSLKIRKLTNLFKHTNINIAFKNTNTIQQYSKPKTIDKNQNYNTSGLYILTCNTCKMSHIGQTSRIIVKDTGNIYVISGTITTNLPTHSIYYKI